MLINLLPEYVHAHNNIIYGQRAAPVAAPAAAVVTVVAPAAVADKPPTAPIL